MRLPSAAGTPTVHVAKERAPLFRGIFGPGCALWVSPSSSTSLSGSTLLGGTHKRPDRHDNLRTPPLSQEAGVATAPGATRGISGVALCTPLLLVRMRERRQRSNRSEREGAPDEQPSGLRVKTHPESESPRRKMPNTANHVATRQVRLMIQVVSVHQKERAKLVSTRTLHGPIVPRIP